VKRARTALPIALGLVLLGAGAASGQDSSWTLFPSHGQVSATPKIQRGKEIFQNLCSGCHGPIIKNASPGIGATMPGTDALAAKYKGAKPAMLEERTDLAPQFVKIYVPTVSR